MFEIYVINLKHRNDRMEKIENIFSNQKYFKLKRFDAIKHENGALGCLSSHLEIIKKNIHKPYCIVIEDDLMLNDTIINIYNVLKLLIKNISNWLIFNGTPTFYSLKKKKIIHSKIKNSPFVNINWGQTTSFMIYSKECYKYLIQLLEKEKLNFKTPIDILISEHFVQTTYLYNNLFYQNEDWSDIEHRENASIDYLKYQKNQELLRIKNTKNLIINKQINYIIGIYTIFIGDYTIFYENFIKSINENFFPNIKKKFFIITNKNLQSYKNTYIVKINDEFIKFPFPTLFRFKYFKKIPKNKLKNIDYMFFLNSNAIISEKISFNDLHIHKNHFLFTLHDAFYNKNYDEISFEKNNISTAYIPSVNNYNYTYVGGRFFGASLQNFIKICNVLYKNILIDLENNYIAKWHDESYLNHFFYNLKTKNYFLAGIIYHIPEEQQYRFDFKEKKIIYLDKSKILNSYPKSWNIKKVKYINNAGNKITNKLIEFYKMQ